MFRPFLSILLLGISALISGLIFGMAVEYYVPMLGTLPISEGVAVIIALSLVGLRTALHSGGHIGRSEVPQESIDRSWEAFRREFDRSRRFDRSFVLMRIPLSNPLDAKDVANLPRALGALDALRLVVRSIDKVWRMQGSIYLLLPESNRASANGLIARLRPTMPDAALDGAQIAEFPQDALTAEALVAALRPAAAVGEAAPLRLVLRNSIDPRADERTG